MSLKVPVHDGFEQGHFETVLDDVRSRAQFMLRSNAAAKRIVASRNMLKVSIFD